MKRFLAVALLLVAMSPKAVAHAGWEIQGDGRLVVELGPCRSWESTNGWCGPSLIVRIPPDVMVGDDEATITGDLVGPDGKVPLQYDSTLLAHNGALLTDTAYWNYRTETVTRTNLPYGRYTYTWTYSYPGQWKCSKYFRSGCIWIDDEQFTWKYEFDWTGARIDTFPVQDKVSEISSVANNVTSASARTLSTTKLADYMSGAGYTYRSSDKITVKVTSGSACKLVKGTIRTVRRGSCKVRLTAITSRGWKYVFKFLVTVK